MKPTAYRQSNVITLQNSSGYTVELLTIGASVYRIFAPGRELPPENIILTLANAASYGRDSSYAGATIGPWAGRIADGKLALDDAAYTLSKNSGSHHLHGGFSSFSAQKWDVGAVSADDTGAGAIFSLHIPDGLDGYPGERQAEVSYWLDEQNTLSITYTALSNQATPYNITNHCYWNLHGDYTQTVSDHVLTVPAEQVYHNAPDHIPCRLAAVAGSPLDLRQERPLGACLERLLSDPQGIPPAGINHCYVLTGEEVTLSCPSTGRRVTVTTDHPCMQIYSGGLLNASTRLDGSIEAHSTCGIALEPQEHPVLSGYAPTITVPGSPYRRTITFAFGIL